MDYSLFGQKFTRHAGITQLMDDLNQGLQNPNAIMLGGGNPAVIPEMQTAFNQQLGKQLGSGELLQALANYDGPKGKNSFTEALAALLQREYGWAISARNIALTNGSQTAFFYLFNLLAGDFATTKKKVLFPLAPEYIGYADSALSEEIARPYVKAGTLTALSSQHFNEQSIALAWYPRAAMPEYFKNLIETLTKKS